jgi:hypothetical protein
MKVAPDYSDAMFKLALLLRRKNQCAEAADYWRRYLAIDSQSECGQSRTPITQIRETEPLDNGLDPATLMHID